MKCKPTIKKCLTVILQLTIIFAIGAFAIWITSLVVPREGLEKEELRDAIIEAFEEIDISCLR